MNSFVLPPLSWVSLISSHAKRRMAVTTFYQHTRWPEVHDVVCDWRAQGPLRGGLRIGMGRVEIVCPTDLDMMNAWDWGGETPLVHAKSGVQSGRQSGDLSFWIACDHSTRKPVSIDDVDALRHASVTSNSNFYFIHLFIFPLFFNLKIQSITVMDRVWQLVE